MIGKLKNNKMEYKGKLYGKIANKYIFRTAIPLQDD